MNSKTHNIVICDDDPVVVNLVALSLELAGYSVLKSLDSPVALELLKSKPDFYDIVILDHMMPKLDGLTMVKELRQCNFPGKILLLSGCLDDQIREEYSRLAVDKMMAKPYKMEDLLNTVAELVAE